MELRRVPLKQKTSPSRSRRKRPFFKLLVLLGILGIGYRWVGGFWQQPEAVLVLGGATEREVFAAEFAQAHPDLSVWVSSGSNLEYSEWVFNKAGISPDRVHRDYQAVDTVTNFTTLADKLKAEGIDSLYLITSDYHMPRAKVIGEIVLGSRGITFEPIEVPSGQAAEPMDKVIRDGARAVLWVVTGSTGDHFADLLSKVNQP
jgi:uncharacterized SAM-binding protein YcdF (DUF218 family)